MNTLKHAEIYILICCALIFCVESAQAQNSDTSRTSQSVPADRDGQHDFDFYFGTWKTHIKRLLHPLTGSTAWAEYDGTTVVYKVWNGHANFSELIADGPAGHLENLALRLYNPESHQWSLNYSNSRSNAVDVPPTVGEFKDGRGEFYDMEPINGKYALVRNVWSDITPDSCRFEQAFSTDNGKTWEVNWIATNTRIKAESDSAR